MNYDFKHFCEFHSGDKMEVLNLSKGWILNIKINEWTLDDDTEIEIESETQIFIPINCCPFCGKDLEE